MNKMFAVSAMYRFGLVVEGGFPHHLSHLLRKALLELSRLQIVFSERRILGVLSKQNRVLAKNRVGYCDGDSITCSVLASHLRSSRSC